MYYFHKGRNSPINMSIAAIAPPRPHYLNRRLVVITAFPLPWTEKIGKYLLLVEGNHTRWEYTYLSHTRLNPYALSL